jgi:hypothetical protein
MLPLWTLQRIDASSRVRVTRSLEAYALAFRFPMAPMFRPKYLTCRIRSRCPQPSR